jgi:hypothetical protein
MIIVFITAKKLTLLIYRLGRMYERDNKVLQSLEQNLRWGVCGWIYVVHGRQV